MGALAGALVTVFSAEDFPFINSVVCLIAWAMSSACDNAGAFFETDCSV